MGDRRIELRNAFNFRDLGGFAVPGGGRTRSGRVYRSDALHRLDGPDIQTLERLDLRAIFDLRSPAELQTDGLGSFVGHAVPHHHAPMMTVTLNPYDATVDWRGINLEERYLAMLVEGAVAIRQVLEAVARCEEGAVVFHCSAGKDRTGVLAAVLLSAVGVPDDAIIEDYAMSEANIARVVEGYREEMQAAGLDDDAIAYLISSPPARMRDTLTGLRRQWGGIESYLDAIGFDAELRELLLAGFIV